MAQLLDVWDVGRMYIRVSVILRGQKQYQGHQ
jgi:hypothetical protein